MNSTGSYLWFVNTKIIHNLSKREATTYVFEIWDRTTLLNLSGLFLLGILLFRLFSEYVFYSNKTGPHGELPVPTCPSWIPRFGHIISLVVGNEQFLRNNKARWKQGVFALNLLGTKHNMIYSPSMIQALFSQRDSVVNFPDSLYWWFISNIGGIPNHLYGVYKPALEDLARATSDNLMREPGFGKITSTIVINLEKGIPNLVTWDGELDKTNSRTWERLANAELSTARGKVSVEVDLLQLITNFVAIHAMPSIFGTDLLNNNPDILQHLWDFNNGFLLLGLGLPGWLPVPGLKRARRGRAAVTRALGGLHRALNLQAQGEDPGPNWARLDTVADVIIERNKVYRSNNIQPKHNSDLSILWAQMANSNFLVFWLLLRIWSDADLTARIRDETKHCVRVDYPTNGAGPPKLTINEKLLVKSCPLLKGSYIESLRMDSGPHAIKKIQQDFTLKHNGKLPLDSKPQSYLLKAGEWANVPFVLHFTDPDYFPDPEIFKPERYIDPAPADGRPDQVSVNWRTVRPFGGGKTMCKGRLYAEREVMACVAGILAVWDVEPVDGVWKLPRKKKATGVYYPRDVVRVRFTQRTWKIGSK